MFSDWRKKVTYQASSPEETKSLEEAMESFFESYWLECDTRLLVKKGIQDWVEIFPRDFGEIRSVSAVEEPPKGYLRSSLPESVIIRMENHGYHIFFKPSKSG